MPQVNHLVAVIRQNDIHEVLTNHGHPLTVAITTVPFGIVASVLPVHERLQVRHGCPS